MSSNSNPSLQFRSIPDIISPYRNYFPDIDFRYVLSALISREEFLTRDFDLKSMHWEREQRRLRREISAIKEREEKGIRVLELEIDELSSKLEILKSSSIESNDRIEGLVRVLCEKDEEICRLVEKLNEIGGEIEKIMVLLSEFDGFVLKVEVLEKEKREVEAKMNEFRRENACLVADKVKFDEELRKLEVLYVGIKDEIDGLRRVLGEKRKEICRKDERIEVLMRRIEALEKEKKENEVKFDEIRRRKKSLVGNLAKFDEQLNKVKMEKNGVEIELIEFQKENEYLIAANKACDEQLDKLDKEKCEVEIKLQEFQRENQRLLAVKDGVDELLKKEKIRGEIKLKECREKEVKIQELNKKIEGLEMEKCEIMKEKEEAIMKYEKLEQPVAKLEKDVARLLVANLPNRKKLMNDQIEKVLSCVIDVLDSEEGSGIDRVKKIQRGAPVASVVNTTSGFVTEVPRETKRRRVLSQCSNQKKQSVDTTVKSLNPSCKVKKAVDLSRVALVHQPPFAASGSRSGKKFTAPPKQVVSPVRQYQDTSVKVKEPLSNPMMGGDSSQRNDSSPQVKKLIAVCRTSRGL